MTGRVELIDSTLSSLTVSWREVHGAKHYILQYRPSSDATRKPVENDDGDDGYVSLSEKLTSAQAKKKNLLYADGPFQFRVRPVTAVDEKCPWITHDSPFQVIHPDDAKFRLERKPAVRAEGNCSAVVSWTPFVMVPGETESIQILGYELQMREDHSGIAWNTVAACVKGVEVRKRNLVKGRRFQFRVRPVLSRLNGDSRDNFEKIDHVPYSSPSESVSALSLSTGLQNLFRNLENNRLLAPKREANGKGFETVPLDEVLVGKIVLLYASAHWCGPCRQFTPQLARFYASHNDVEVVFLSCDHDERGFNSYFSTMPWTAVPYDSDVRERLLSWIRVTGIPRLVVLNSSTGAILEDNVVGKPMDVARWKRMQ